VHDSENANFTQALNYMHNPVSFCVSFKTAFYSWLFPKHRRVKKCCCFDIFQFVPITFQRPLVYSSVVAKTIALHNVRVFEMRLIPSLNILCENLVKLAHQTDWHLVAIFATFLSSNSSTDKMRSLNFSFHTSLFQQNIFLCSLLIRCIWVLDLSRKKRVSAITIWYLVFQPAANLQTTKAWLRSFRASVSAVGWLHKGTSEQ